MIILIVKDSICPLKDNNKHMKTQNKTPGKSH